MTTSTSRAADLDGLPGRALVEQGLRDLAAGERTPEALLLCVAANRLRALGLEVPRPCPGAPELALYRALADAGCNDPYYRYNALRRELDSFLAAATSRQRRRAAG